MAISVNRVTLVGNVGSEPEARGQGGLPVTFSVATNRRWKDQNGESRDDTQWHKIVVWNKSAATFAEKYVKKGDLIFIEGAVETRKWEKDGQDVYITEIVVRPFDGNIQSMSRDGGRQSDDRRTDDRKTEPTPSSRSSYGGGSSTSHFDDEIPF